MPELPDIVSYLEALSERVEGAVLEQVRLASPFVVRSFDPPIREAQGRKVVGLSRLGKRLVLELEGDLRLVIHLMIAGRLQWKERGAKIPGRVGLAAFDFPSGTLVLTEASTQKRASIHLVRGDSGLEPFRRGGLEPLEATLPRFAEVLARENHTLKRSLTDPRLFSGIGNAYSDEILHRAKLSPVKLSQSLSEDEVARLYAATSEVLREWVERFRTQRAGGFPEKVTAFRPEMAVHGKYRQPCPVCQTPVQRIVHAANETNYCPRCQTGGKLLADRALSKLLKQDWPKTIDELEERRAERPAEPAKPTAAPPGRRARRPAKSRPG